MHISVDTNPCESGQRAANKGAALIRKAILEKGKAEIILATGASQFNLLESLVRHDIDWGKVTAFHLDEYVGISSDHPASFCRYLRERFETKLPCPLAGFHYLSGEADAETVRCSVGEILLAASIDVAFVGIGENGHLAFNDPPADFDCEEPYILVQLDEACRRQQLGEGWFASLEAVPKTAISMSIRQIMKCKSIICTVPDERKAEAVRRTVEGPVSPDSPASVLQNHGDCHLYLDRAAASKLQTEQETFYES
jgi:glucosamine-6-phosphate deaminase